LQPASTEHVKPGLFNGSKLGKLRLSCKKDFFAIWGGGERLDSEAARKSEHAGLGGSIQGLSMRADELKLNVFGNTAIATLILNYSFKTGGARQPPAVVGGRK
jgi:hypothetical protein